MTESKTAKVWDPDSLEEFTELDAEIASLVTLVADMLDFAPDPIKPVDADPLEDLSDEQMARLRGYVALCHAAIEEHIEDTFLMAARNLYRWREAEVLPASVAQFSYALATYLPVAKLDSQSKRALPNILRLGASEYRALYVEKNHGVQRRFVEKLLHGLGIPSDEMLTRLNDDIEDLGTLARLRGESVHLSPKSLRATKVTRAVRASNVYEYVQNAAQGAHVIRAALLEVCPAPPPLGEGSP